MDQRTCVHWGGTRQTGRVRVLIEDPSPALAVSDFRRFEEAGLDVALCHGPDAGEPCPLVVEGTCPLAEEADVVVMGRDLAAGDRDEIAKALHRLRPRLPVLAEVARTPGEEVPAGCIPLPSPSSVPGQIRAVGRAADRPPPPRRP